MGPDWVATDHYKLGGRACTIDDPDDDYDYSWDQHCSDWLSTTFYEGGDATGYGGGNDGEETAKMSA